MADTPEHPATKLRIQLSANESFAELIWDSGFTTIAATASGVTTPAVAYAGPQLEFGITLYWRAAIQDDQSVSSPYSATRYFSIAETGAPADLRTTTGIATESIQGNPVAVVNWPPSLTAENTADDDIAYGQVQVSQTADFNRPVWDSGWLPVGAVQPGQRTDPIEYQGDVLPIESVYFWRVRMAEEPEGDTPWSAATSSFIQHETVAGTSSPAGFAKESRTFGPEEYNTSDVAFADVLGNGVPDAVLATSTAGLSHVLYPDVGTATPGQPLSFGAAAGGRTRVVVRDFNLDGAPDVATVDQDEVVVYVYSDGVLQVLQQIELGGQGEPVEVQVADTNWDGWPDIVVAFELEIVQFFGSEDGFGEGELLADLGETVTSLLVTDFYTNDDLCEYWVVSGAVLYLYRNADMGVQEWPLEGASQIALADPSDPSFAELVFAGPTTVGRCTVTLLDYAELDFHSTVEHGFNAPCLGVVGARIDDDSDSDAVVLLQGAVLVMRKLSGSFELHEYVGHPGGPAECRVRVGDANMDGHSDIVVARADSPSELYFNRPRLTVGIADTEATQVLFGEAYAEFVVTLSDAPVSMVEVFCETYEEDPPGGGEGGDGLPDPGEWLNAQVSPSPYVPTTHRLVFAPGQVTKRFYVPLTSYYAGSVWTLYARIFRSTGALVSQGTASASVYGVPPNPSGPPSTPGLQRDWDVHGDVRAIVEAGGNTYFGGDFDGIAWDSGRLAAVTNAGERRLALPSLTSGQIRCVAVDPGDGSIYFGGDFVIQVNPTTQVRNIAKCTAAGTLVPGFAPNPNGPVNSIDLDSYGRVYFGGKFNAIAKHPGQAYRNIGWVSSTGGVATGTYGSARFGVINGSSTGNDEVLVLKVSHSGTAGEYLLVGGQGFNQAYNSAMAAASPFTVGNFVGFSISTGHVLVNPKFSFGAVRAIEVDTSRLIGYSGQTSHPIIIGGSFQYGTFGAFGSGQYTSSYLAVTNFLGFYSTSLAVPGSTSPVSALAIDASGRLWVGRQLWGPVGATDPLAIYTWSTGLVQASFSSGINAAVTGLAIGDDVVLATGSFSVADGTAVAGMAVLSTQTGSLGDIVPLRAAPAGGGVLAAAATHNGGGQNGWLICGTFTEVLAQRDNLAAMNAQGQLLPWGPSTSGPVNAMVSDGAKVIFGGTFNSVNGATHVGIAAALADDDSTATVGWAPILNGCIGVHALAISGSYALIGGQFSGVQTGGGPVTRNHVAAINLSSGSLGTWNPNLATGANDGVYALLVDGPRVYIGGSFLGVIGVGTAYQSLLAVGAPGESNSGQLITGWQAGLPTPCNVTGLAQTADKIVFIGDFQQVGTQPRAGAACVDKTTAVLADFEPIAHGGLFRCVAATSGGLIYLGGDFLAASEDAATQSEARKGVVALDVDGEIQGWTCDVLGSGASETVSVIWIESSSGIGRIWLGGEFTGTAHAGQHDLTWFSGGWYITTSSLPAAVAGSSYTSPAMQLSEPVSCTWSISAPGAPGLSINSSGVISGTAPNRQPGQWLAVPVMVTADAGGGITTSRLFLLTIAPPPPPTWVRITGPTNVTEGDDMVLAPAQQWTVELTQPFSTPVHVSIQYQDGTAHSGYDYSPWYTELIFYPQGTPIPTELGPHTLATSNLTLDVPVTTFGNTAVDAPRAFTISITSMTPNVGADPGAYYVVVNIVDDDPPQPRPAYARNLALRENASTPANAQGVVAEQPWLAWDFGTDTPGETQGHWQVQVAQVADFSTVTYDSMQTAGADTVAQLGAIPDGLDCFARVRVWPASGGSASDWTEIAFHRNTSPALAAQLAPGSTPPASASVPTARPVLTWAIQDDGDGDSQFFVVHIQEVGGSVHHVIDSRTMPYLFDQYNGSSWSPISQAGVPSGMTGTRVRLPAEMTLAASPAEWDWWVDSVDPFELVLGTEVARIEVVPGYVIQGVYTDAAGVSLIGRELNAVLLPNHAALNSSPVVTGPNGEFQFTIQQALVTGDIIAICIDPAAINPATLLPFNEYAGVILRFPGSDLIDTDGIFRKVTLVHGTCLLDERGVSGFNLGDLQPPALPLTSVSGYPFQKSLDQLQLLSQFTGLELACELRVRDTFAAAGEPTSLALAVSQALRITDAGSLSIEEGGVAQLDEMGNSGTVIVHATGRLTLAADSESSGELHLLEDGFLDLDDASLTLTAGAAAFHAGVISGVAGTESVISLDGSFTVAGTQFDNCILEIGPSAEAPEISNAIFAPGTNTRCIFWRRAMAQAASMSGLRFETGPGDNVYAEAGTDTLTMTGCGGDLAGEAYDYDPGEAVSVDIIVWETAAITGLAAYSGNERVLLVWDAGAQTGTGFTFEVHEATVETGPFTAIDTTADSFYVHSQLTNYVPHFYFIRTITSGLQADSDVIACIPREALIEHSSPPTVSPTGMWPASILGSNTHFRASTQVVATTTGMAVPANSILVLSPNLMLFDIETVDAPQEAVTLSIETPDVWSDLGAPGYSEQLAMYLEVEAMPTPDYPTVVFVQTGGAVGADDFTDGAFTVAVEFDARGGAPIDPTTFECIVDRDIEVGGQPVAAGAGLAHTSFQLWGTPSASGAAWVVEQEAANPAADEEFIEPGEIKICVRVGNEYGLVCQWQALRIFVQGGDADRAYASTDILQGVDDQVVTIACNTLAGATDVWFPDDAEIDVTDVQVVSSDELEVTLNAGINARVGRFDFEVGTPGSPNNITSVGTYHLVTPMEGVTPSGGFMMMSMGAGDPGPRAARGAANVVLQNGEFRWSTTDLVVQGRKLPIVWDRHYRSTRADDTETTPFGKGWFGTYFQHLIAENDGETTSITWHTATGDRHVFTPGTPQGAELSRFEPPAGIAALAIGTRLDYTSDATTAVRLQTEDGLHLFFEAVGLEQDSTKERMRLERIEDAYHNSVRLQYDDPWDYHPRRILTDTTSAADYGDYLALDYRNGCVETVTRYVGVYPSEWKEWNPGTQREQIKYRYSEHKQLVTQELPSGHRHGALYHGYVYSGDDDPLVRIYPPQYTAWTVSGSDNNNNDYYSVDETISGIVPTIDVAYDSSGRVTEQRLGPDLSSTSQSRKFTIAYVQDSQPLIRTVTTAEAVSATYVLDIASGQPIYISQGGQTTTYVHDGATHALLAVQRPRGDATHYTYDRGQHTVTGTYSWVSTALDPGSGEIVSTFLCSNAFMHLYHGDTIRLGTAGGVVRYFIVASSSSGNTLKVFGDSVELGVPPTGNFHIYESAGPALTRFRPVQERHVPAAISGVPTPPSLITTWNIIYQLIEGIPHPMTEQIIDPRGNITSIGRKPQQYSGEGRGEHTVVSTTRWYAAAKNAFENTSPQKTVSTTVLDQHGRVVQEQDVTSDYGGAVPVIVRYEYHDSSTCNGYRGLIKSVTTTDAAGNVVADGSTAGGPTSYAYDGLGHLKTVDTSSAGSNLYDITYHTNDAGQVYRVEQTWSGDTGTGGRGETWFYYDKNGRLEREVTAFKSSLGSTTLPAPGTDPQNLTVPSAIEGAFLPPGTLTGAGWVHTVYTYNYWGEVASVTQDIDLGPVKAVTTNVYDRDGRLTRVTNSNAPDTTYTYDNRNLTTSVAVGPTVTSYAYDANGNLLTEKDATGFEVTYEYDGHNRLLSTSTPAAGGPLVEKITYPGNTGPNIVRASWHAGSSDDILRAEWTEHDAFGRPFRTHTLARDTANNGLYGSVAHAGLPCTTDATRLDARGDSHATYGLRDEGELGYHKTSSTSYDAFARPKETKGADGRVTGTSFHDGIGNLWKHETPGVTWVGNEASLFDVPVTFTYDPSGQVASETRAAGMVATYQRDNRGLVEKVTDAAGRYTETQYNFVGWPRLTKTGDSTNQVQTETIYNLAGQVVWERAWPNSSVPAGEQITKYTYDGAGRLQMIDRPDAGETYYFYDAAGRLKYEFRQPDNIVVVQEHDTAGNVTAREIKLLGGTGASIGQEPSTDPIEVETYTYNAFGEILTATSKDTTHVTSSLMMEYNTLGLIEKQSLTVYENGTPILVDVQFGHSYNSNQLGFNSLYSAGSSLPDLSTWTMQQAYDAAGRGVNSTFWDGRSVRTYHYDGAPRTVVDDSTTLLGYDWIAGTLAGRTFSPNTSQSRHVISPRPGALGKTTTPPWSNGYGCPTQFGEDSRGDLSRVSHGHRNDGSGTDRTFAEVEVRRDYSGNPVLERRLHQGGLSRVMHYDFAGRLDAGLRGHLIDLAGTQTMPGDDLAGTSPYVNPLGLGLPHQSRRMYSQDEVDNITGYQDVSGATSTSVSQNLLQKNGGLDQRNLIGARSDAPSDAFTYDLAGRMTYDPTTQLHYEHNYCGQVTSIKSGGDVLRRMTYDCFGRMVHQVDAPGKPQERGTIFIPNVGFGGDGGGADTAGEVSYIRDGTDYAAIEVVQFTYGYGAIGGGIGYKRLVELIAYCREFAPYYRFLHEDTLGSTIATTSLWGDRLDEYDYTDYGVPIHAPVALDGRWITDIVDHSTHPDVSVVTLAGDVLEPNELLGCEIRVVDPAPADAEHVFASGTVISHLGTTLHIRDVGNTVADAWANGTDESRALTAIYELREGFVQGTMDGAATGTYTGHGWLNEPCTLITVDHGPFDDTWMYTQAGFTGLSVTLGPDSSGGYVPAMVLGALDQVTGSGMKKLAVSLPTGGAVPASYVGAGKRYLIDGNLRVHEVARSGEWALDATSVGGVTTFTVNAHAAITPEMQGWILQPDINRQVYAPILYTDPNTHTVTVAGDYAAIATQGTRFRIHAMPGTVTYGEKAGVLMESTSQHVWVAAASSRCLYNGYRYEAPLAGTTELVAYTLQTTLRQGGKNFAGQHYTLNRHYDPNLMRFTSPDPAATPFHNLGAYCGNNPAGGYDPDGLSVIGPYKNDWENRPTEALINTGLDIFGTALTKVFAGPLAMVASGLQVAEGENVGDTFVGQQVREVGNRYEARVDNSNGSLWGHITAMQGIGNDMAGITAMGESITGRDNITGQTLSDTERYNRFVDGASSMLLTAAIVAGPKIIPAASRVGGKSKVGGTGSSFWRNPNRTLRPGSFVAERIPARSPAQTFIAAERAAIDAIGYKRGCHTCGIRIPGTKRGHFIPDHQAVSALNEAGVPQILYPHCLRCSKEQGLAVARVQKLAKKLLALQKGKGP